MKMSGEFRTGPPTRASFLLHQIGEETTPQVSVSRLDLQSRHGEAGCVCTHNLWGMGVSGRATGHAYLDPLDPITNVLGWGGVGTGLGALRGDGGSGLGTFYEEGASDSSWCREGQKETCPWP